MRNIYKHYYVRRDGRCYVYIAVLEKCRSSNHVVIFRNEISSRSSPYRSRPIRFPTFPLRTISTWKWNNIVAPRKWRVIHERTNQLRLILRSRVVQGNREAAYYSLTATIRLVQRQIQFNSPLSFLSTFRPRSQTTITGTGIKWKPRYFAKRWRCAYTFDIINNIKRSMPRSKASSMFYHKYH